MQILWLDTVDSTQDYLVRQIKSQKITLPVIVAAKHQTAGKGSRGNEWCSLEGNLFFSFALPQSSLPQDLPLCAASIYFSYLLKEVLADQGSKVWIKWPNDFYLEEKKIGGTITTIVKENLVCGIGLNLQTSPENFESLDIKMSSVDILNVFSKILEKTPSWKKVLKKFEVEFERSRSFFTHDKNGKISLEQAQLCDDGALIVDGKRIYSLR